MPGRDKQNVLLAGEYELREVLAEGGMGTVYLGVHPVLGKRVAVKVLAPRLAANQDAVERFVFEARTVGTIRHPNIVDIFSFGRLDDGRPFYIMELLEGESLAARLEQKGPLEPADAVLLLVPIADALAAAHEVGIVHRDVKPQNVFLVEGRGLESAKLLDFGVAKLLDPEASRTTKGNEPLGTPLYMSPEQCEGQRATPRSDVYAFGTMLYEALTGRPPFGGEVMAQVIAQKLTAAPEPPSALAELPAALDELVLECLAREPARRPRGMSTVRDRLIRIASTDLGVNVASPPRRPARRGNLGFVLRIVALQGVVLAGAYLLVRPGPAPSAAVPQITSAPAPPPPPAPVPAPAPPARGVLIVTTNAPRATIAVDGEVRGRGASELRLELEAGKHRVEVRAPGYRRAEVEVTVEAGALRPLHLATEPERRAPPSAKTSAERRPIPVDL